ncbi:bifunctional alpha,alpha-trehalose-phosphate synthase (UDP-forming)/trehalose-phosphatase [Leucobacter allii]|uniref:Bifunctional alpha,alpha-trehalose-phosphate synthase (UDP-forming)/trehalose-phosphatase n=1 Tax=Leucobacter allii TaxID=2932247 RepID=A0ABY4FI15_9MICO|nr:bifunctional alpha,alpha-trehalose-phosphate synthase (UDP-forming)/trehalose-phosphatase [Leucobacter allii]UOQ56190.1 bifunctional alpha,alpha-trehalose-phosphate synthase (UDP-forming)/trehalose-phosphatase [Leucobacter allii]UOR00658.1 bifunctional alpha,alpha-trehalose-phosphate synthase (UDP-forming)/trehalose-phosphatase [Leucobacter allii]
MNAMQDMTGGRELVMVSNRLPVDRVTNDDGSTSWRASPGGLVTAVQPIVEQLGCVWVGWAGSADEAVEPFELGAMRLVPIELSAEDIALYYEGFSNGTLWPLYHDVIAQPEYHREWWDRYRRVNQRFAEQVAATASEQAIVWVHDYQLQLVPAMLRELRPDLTIAFFLHIPFPPGRLFAQLPWRRQVVRGLLGADVIGFQQTTDAVAFRMAVERFTRAPALGNTIVLPASADGPSRTVLAQEFPISIDAESFAEIARRPETRERAKEIRADLGDPRIVMLGVDRLDYTKGIRHRLKAFNELLEDGELDPTDIVFVQVASPSRERVDAYRQLRDEVEGTVGRINGAHGTIGRAPLNYLHRGFTRDEMVALYLAADVLLVTPLRDGMNLVAKEYVACRDDERGVLVLSEFAGAADELRDALLVNPHDIEGLKAAIVRAAHMPREEQRRRMHALRRAVADNDVAHWAAGYLGAVRAAAESGEIGVGGTRTEPVAVSAAFVPRSIDDRIRRLAASPALIVATDFDGTLAPIVPRPQDARILPRAQQAIDVLRLSPGVSVAVLTGRSLAGLAETGLRTEGWIVSGSHGSELAGLESEPPAPLSEDETLALGRATRRFERIFGPEAGVRLERKPFGLAVHTREVADPVQADELLAAAVELGAAEGLQVREGKQVREFSVRAADKGTVLRRIRDALPEAPVLFLGDDVTDEDVFRVLGPDDLGIKVGPGETAASERVPDTATAAAVIALLAELRTGIVIGSDAALPED